MTHVLGAPFHPQTQSKIERWRQTMKNRVLLENHYLPGNFERQIGVFVEYNTNQRYHESLKNVTPADVYFGRDKAILRKRRRSVNRRSNNAACNTRNKPRNQSINQSHERAKASNTQAAMMSQYI